jgi:hypothetical protein
MGSSCQERPLPFTITATNTGTTAGVDHVQDTLEIVWDMNPNTTQQDCKTAARHVLQSAREAEPEMLVCQVEDTNTVGQTAKPNRFWGKTFFAMASMSHRHDARQRINGAHVKISDAHQVPTDGFNLNGVFGCITFADMCCASNFEKRTWKANWQDAFLVRIGSKLNSLDSLFRR